MCFTCYGSKDVCNIRVRNEKSAPVRVLVDGNGVVRWDIEVVRLVYDADYGPYRAEGCVFAVTSVCNFLPVFTVFW